MPDSDSPEDYRHRLLALRAELTGETDFMAEEALRGDSMENNGRLSSVPQHLADRASDAYEQAFTLARLEDASELIVEIDDALDRMERGSYGACEDCGEAIPDRRLRMRPYARLCVTCKQREEEEAGAS